MMTTAVLAGEGVWRVSANTAWEKIRGTGSMRGTEDGWVWDARPVDRGATWGVRLPVDLADFDEIRFDYKPTHGPVQLVVTTDGYPSARLSRNWYDKNVQKPGEWNSVAFDLRLDDDGIATKRPDSQDLWIAFNFAEDAAQVRDDRRRVELRNPRLVRHPVEWRVDYFRTRTRRVGDRVEVSYPITLRNRTDKTIEVALRFEREPPRTGEPLFTLPEEPTWTLKPPTPMSAAYDERWGARSGDALGAWITFSADAKAALARPPLWTEIVWPRVEVEGFSEPILPLHSSRFDPWFLTVPPRNVVHPVVEVTPAKLRRAVRRNAVSGRFKGVLDNVLATARRRLKAPWALPRQITLQTSDAYRVHADNGRRCLALARAWSFTGEEAFRTAALDVLNAYADQYLLWSPLRESSTAFRSRTMSNTLMEGFRMWSFFVAYDYLRPTLSTAEIQHVEDRFLLPLARTLDGHVLAYNNQMTQHQYNVFYYAVATENWPLAMRYVEGPRGLFAMRTYGFDVDGMGMERDPGYHGNTVTPMVGIMVTLEHLGFDDSELDMEPLLSVPVALGHAGKGGAYPFDVQYEWGLAHYGNTGFLPAIGDRAGLGALLHGVDVPPQGDMALAPAHLEHAGYVVLRRRLANDTIRSLSVNYGSPDHRGHIDLLSVHVLQDRKWIFGMMGQQFGRTGWFSTVADCLLAVNGRDQLASGRGRLVRMEQGTGWQAIEVATSAATPLYKPAVTYHRLLVDAGPFVVLLDRATASEPVTFDWAFYPGIDYAVPDDWQPGEAPRLDAGPKGNGPGCTKVRKDWRAAPKHVERLLLSADYQPASDGLPVTILARPAAQPFAFRTPGDKKKGWINGLLLVNHKLSGASWAAVADLSGASAKIRAIQLIDSKGASLVLGAGMAVQITGPDARWDIAFADRKANARLPDGTPLEDGWLVRKAE